MISSFIEILPFRSWIKYKDKPLTGRRPEWLFATKGIDPRQLRLACSCTDSQYNKLNKYYNLHSIFEFVLLYSE